MKPAFTVLPLVAALSMTLASQASAAEQVTSDTVKVTASRVEQELLDVPMSVTVVTSDKIKGSTARTVGELLEDVPGVQVMNDGSQGLKRISIRGEDAFRTLVLVDGQKISEHKSMSGAPILIDPSAIERIEVIKGPASVLYGSDAIGGVVNVITKKGSGKAFSGDVSASYNSASEGGGGAVTLSGTVDRFKYRISGNYEDHGNLDTPKGKLENSLFRQKSGGLFLSYDLTDNLTAGINADTFDSRIKSGSFDYQEEYGKDSFYIDIPKWKRDKVGLFVEARNVNEYLNKVRWDGFWQKTNKQMLNHIAVDGANINNFADNKITTYGATLQADWQLGSDHFLITGYDFSIDKLEADTDASVSVIQSVSTMPGRPPMQVSVNTNTHRFNKGEQTSHAIFASMESQLPQDLTLNYGVRYTWVDTEMSKAVASKTGSGMVGSIPMFTYNGDDDGSAGKTGSKDNSRAVFNAGLVWRGIDDMALRATWAQGFRVPIMQEKYLYTSMGSSSGGGVWGNPDLKPETSDNFEIGSRYDNGNAVLDVSLFYSDAKDYISTAYMENGVDQHYVNYDKARSRGLEMSAEYTFADTYTPYATLTWMRRKVEGHGYSTYASGTPEFYARYGLRTKHNVAFGGKLRTDTYLRSQTATESYSASSDTTTSIGGFTTVNFALGYTFGPQDRYLLNAELLNIFDKAYQYNTATWEAGRHVNVKFNASF